MKLFGIEQRQPKRYLAGTHRTRSPRETLDDYRRFMPLMGITRLANVTGLDYVGIPVFMAVRPNSRVLAVSQGKGLDPDAARASALMETIEHWHAERMDLPLCFDSHQSLVRKGEPAVRALEDLPRLPGSRIPRDRPLLWVQGHDLFTDARTWIPEECAGLNMVLPQGQTPIFLRGGNGLASGNHPLEATTHALLEALERDAVTLWHLDDGAEETKATQIELATIDDALCLSCLQKIQAAKLNVAVWDATSDLGIPAYVATIFDDPEPGAVGAFSGYGCHLSPGIALLRALTEAVQSRLTIISGSRDDMLPAMYQRQGHEEMLTVMREEVLDVPARLDFRARRSLATETFEDDLAVLLRALQGASLTEAVALDFSRPEIGIPVVKVVVPGLAAYHGHAHEPGPRERAR